MRFNLYSTIVVFCSSAVFVDTAIAQSTRVLQNTSPPAAHPQISVYAGADEKMVGGGAFADWNGNGSLLTQIEPGGSTSWSAAAKDHMVSDPSALTVYGIALRDPANEYDVVVTESTSAIAAHPVATAQVPAGYVMASGGCRVNWRTSSSAAGNLLTASFPQTNQIWECRAKDHAVSSPATITAFVVGIRPRNAGTPMPQIKIDRVTSAIAAHPEVTVHRSDPNFIVTGGGARIDNGPPYSTGGQLLTRSAPLIANQNGPITSWVAKGKDHGVPSPGTITAFVVSLNFNPTPVPPPGFTGYQIVASPNPPVEVRGGQTASVTATCPAGKVSLSAGYRFLPKRTFVNPALAEVERGFEVLAAEPVWRPSEGAFGAMVTMRNAHPETATLEGFAVCVDARPDITINSPVVLPDGSFGFVTMNVAGATVANGRGRAQSTCASGSVVVGGGLSTMFGSHIKTNAPNLNGLSWTTEVIDSGVSVFLRASPKVVCALASLVTSRTVVTSGQTALPSHGEVSTGVSCPGTTRLLAAGIDDSTIQTGIDMIPVRLLPSGNGVSAKIHNRHTTSPTPRVNAEVIAICANATP